MPEALGDTRTQPFGLRRRLTLLIAIPTTIAAGSIVGLSAISLGAGNTAVAGALLLLAVAMTIPVGLIARRTIDVIDDGTEPTSASAIMPDEPAGEFAEISDAFQELAERQRHSTADTEALERWREELTTTSAELEDSRALTASLMDSVSDAIIVLDGAGRMLASNAVATHALEFHDGDLDAAIPGWQELSIGDHELTLPSAAGSLTLIQVSVSQTMTSTGAITLLCWRDLSGDRAVEAQVTQIAQTDIVTGLPNRRGLLAAHDRLCELHRSASVIHLDLAAFGQVNQRHGFEEGDHVLQVISQRLREVTRDGDTVARVSGDEFVLLLESQGDVVDSMARRILDHVADPIVLRNGSSISLKAHAGWSTGAADESYELLRRASFALAEAKDEPGTVSSYSAETAQRDANRRQWEEQLRRAISDDEFALFAQPIVDVFERRVLGVEIFLRWNHPSGRLISPAEFIDIANESELIIDIDRWVIRKTIEEATEADPTVVFSLNVSSRFMASSTMADYVMASLSEHAVPAGRVQIDVTETNVESDANGVIDSIRRLNEMGVKVALDDFGTGYSSLAHLLKLAVSTIKIDRRMVANVDSPEGRGVVAAILAFAKKRNLLVVAEGVESAEEVTALAELGCRYQQGYHHAHPAPLAEVLSTLDHIPFREPTPAAVVADAHY